VCKTPHNVRYRGASPRATITASAFRRVFAWKKGAHTAYPQLPQINPVRVCVCVCMCVCVGWGWGARWLRDRVLVRQGAEGGWVKYTQPTNISSRTGREHHPPTLRPARNLGHPVSDHGVAAVPNGFPACHCQHVCRQARTPQPTPQPFRPDHSECIPPDRGGCRRW
jgi:hypothetical protein